MSKGLISHGTPSGCDSADSYGFHDSSGAYGLAADEVDASRYLRNMRGGSANDLLMISGGLVYGREDVPSVARARSLRGPTSVGVGPTGSSTYVPKGLVWDSVAV
uniref:Uncharacterized protein n=1 Tax=Haptolina ericina TaxID=156174 RepID=A0A7S3EYV0_9EUKA